MSSDWRKSTLQWEMLKPATRAISPKERSQARLSSINASTCFNVRPENPARVKRGGQAFAIEAAARIAAFHLFLQGPANVFDLRIADLKAVPEFEMLRVQARFFGYVAQELRSKA